MNLPEAQILPQNRYRRPVFCFVVLGGILIAGISARFLLENGFAWKCPSIVLFGLPCPSCGLTRAFVALSQFQFVEALRFNPLLVLSLLAVVVAPMFKVGFESLERRGAWFWIGVAVALNWVYLLLFLPR